VNKALHFLHELHGRKSFCSYFTISENSRVIERNFTRILNKGRLYQSNYFFNLFESQARMNLGRAILAL